MFTGLVEAIGTIERVADTPSGREFRVSCPWKDLAAGDSVSLNGACLTVREAGDGWFLVAAVTTTLGRTCMESWTSGTLVNLERAMRLGDRLGGHLVQGHVDDMGTVRTVARQ
jgi:riboflavin synthase